MKRMLLVVLWLLVAPATRAQTIWQLRDSLWRSQVAMRSQTIRRLEDSLRRSDAPETRSLSYWLPEPEKEDYVICRWQPLDLPPAVYRELTRRIPDSAPIWAFLDKRLSQDSNDAWANKQLAERYYARFLNGYQALCQGVQDEAPARWITVRQPELTRREADSRKADAARYAPMAMRHMLRLWRTDTSYRPGLQQAMLQMAGFLQDDALPDEISAYREVIYTDSAGIPVERYPEYFTVRALLDTSDDSPRNEPGPADCLAATDDALYYREWFSGPLAYYQEPLLDGASRSNAVYRFTWIPRTGASAYAVVFRVETEDGGPMLYTKADVWMRKGWKRRQQVLITKRRLTMLQLQTFQRLLDSARFFQQRAGREILRKDGAEWLEEIWKGAEWVLEANEQGRYHLAHRWKGGELEPVCRYLISLAPKGVRRKAFY